MDGSLYYVIGDDFSVRDDLWALAARVAAESRHAGYSSAVRLLFDLAVVGFNPEQMNGLLHETDFEDILLFEDSGMRLAFDVPGNGRASTPDIMLLAVQFCPRRGEFEDPAALDAFVAIALDRRVKGRCAKWPFAKT